MKKNMSALRHLSCLIMIVFSPLLIRGNDKIEIKIEAEITKNGFVGETFLYEVKLLSTSPDISNVKIISAPSFPEGIRAVQGVSRNFRSEKITVKGKTFYSWTIMRNFLIPDRSGKFTIGSGKFLVFIPHEKILYHDFWGPRRTVEYEEMRISCGEATFKVIDLPSVKNEELAFSGCVGDYKIEGWFPPGKIYKGKEAYAVFSIGGYGSLRNLKVPGLYKIFGNGCQLREVEQNEEQMQRDGKLYSEVTLTCRFMPEEDEFYISPLSLLFFNPRTKKYYSVSSEALHWTSVPEKKSNRQSNEAIEI